MNPRALGLTRLSRGAAILTSWRVARLATNLDPPASTGADPRETSLPEPFESERRLLYGIEPKQNPRLLQMAAAAH